MIGPKKPAMAGRRKHTLRIEVTYSSRVTQRDAVLGLNLVLRERLDLGKPVWAYARAPCIGKVEVKKPLAGGGVDGGEGENPLLEALNVSWQRFAGRGTHDGDLQAEIVQVIRDNLEHEIELRKERELEL